MTRLITNNGQGSRTDDGAERKPTGLAVQLLAAVETFGVDDTRAALREIREHDTATEASR